MGQGFGATPKGLNYHRVSEHREIQKGSFDHHNYLSQYCSMLLNAWIN
jgi:hypothetical protein